VIGDGEAETEPQLEQLLRGYGRTPHFVTVEAPEDAEGTHGDFNAR
jgi:xylulose-5-phosphate/fructose-6-phosphate phosphoketolase